LNINFNLGYLPLGGNRNTLVENAWEMTSSKKLYPRYIDGTIGTNKVVSAGTVKQGVAFRGWSKIKGRSNDFLIKNGNDYYLYLDYHFVGRDSVDLPEELLGMKIEILDKSPNLSIKSTIAMGILDVEISSSTPKYAYCELKFS